MRKDDNRDLTNIYFWDIETSTLMMDDGVPMQVTYLNNLLCFNMQTGNVVSTHFERTIEDMFIHFSNIASEDKNIIIYAHNLHYELIHLLRSIPAQSLKNAKGEIDAFNEEKDDSVFRSKNSPLSIHLDVLPYITFRDSYALFNKSVAQLGESLTKRTGRDFGKLEYDYKKKRTPWDQLERLDYDYNERDNIIVAYSMYYYLQDHQLTMDKIPLTFTAQTKKDRFDFIQKHHTKSTGIYTVNRDKYDCYADADFYAMCDRLYQGGLTTANINYIKQHVHHVYSIDIKSSYPYQVCTRRFPFFDKDSTTRYVMDEANEYYYNYLDGLHHTQLIRYFTKNEDSIKGYLLKADFKNLRVKNTRYLLSISVATLINPVNVEKVNGKLVSCDECTMLLSNVSLDMLKLTYEFDSMYVKDLYTTYKSRFLRECEIHFLLNAFDIKESTDKDAEPLAYALAKVNINSGGYGVKVQKTIRSTFSIVDGEINEVKYHALPEFRLEGDEGLTRSEVYQNYLNDYYHQWDENLNNIRNSKNFDIFADGMYITEFARYMLVEMMTYLTLSGFDVIYCDTDSLKFIANDSYFPQNELSDVEHKKVVDGALLDILDRVNGNIIKANQEHDRFMTYRKKFKTPKKIYDKMCKLGTWDLENKWDKKKRYVYTYPYFQTLGAKKYCYIDYDKNKKEVVKTTIAGCSKGIAKTIMLYADNQQISYTQALMQVFRVGTQFDETCSGRTVAKVEERPREYCSQLTYQGREVNQCGGIIITDTTYTLDITDDDYQYLYEEEFSQLVRKKKEDKTHRVLNAKGELRLLH